MTLESLVVCLDIYEWLTRASESGTYDPGKISVHRLCIKKTTSILVFPDDQSTNHTSNLPTFKDIELFYGLQSPTPWKDL
jgi:hypothetical protein